MHRISGWLIPARFTSFSIANILKGPPLPSLILTGIANTVAPVTGTLSKFATFSRPTMLAPKTVTWVWKSRDRPKSMEGVSTPMALMYFRLSIIHLAVLGLKPGKWKVEESLGVLDPKTAVLFGQYLSQPEFIRTIAPSGIWPCFSSHCKRSSISTWVSGSCSARADMSMTTPGPIRLFNGISWRRHLFLEKWEGESRCVPPCSAVEKLLLSYLKRH